MKKSIVIKGMLLILLGGLVLSLTGCSSKEIKEIKNSENIQSQANVVEKNEESDNKQASNNASNETKKESETVSKNSDKVNTVKKSETSEDNKTQLSKEEIVKKAYLNSIAEMAKDENYKLSDYKVEKIQIVSFDEVKQFSPDIEQYYTDVKDSDIFATVTYSVKPADSMDKTYWIAGNGEIDGQWIKNKEANIRLVENNGEYTIKEEGTGW